MKENGVPSNTRFYMLSARHVAASVMRKKACVVVLKREDQEFGPWLKFVPVMRRSFEDDGWSGGYQRKRSSWIYSLGGGGTHSYKLRFGGSPSASGSYSLSWHKENDLGADVNKQAMGDDDRSQ